MQHTKDRILSEDNQFIIRETDLRILKNHPYRLHGGGMIFCKKGRATISVDTKLYDISTDTQVFIIPDTVVMINKADEEFRAIFFYFTRQLFEDAHRQFAPSFFHHLKHYPVYYHSLSSAKSAQQLFSIIMEAYSDIANRFRTAIVANCLRIFLLNIYDKIQRNVVRVTSEGYKRKEELFHRFIELILENCTTHRDVEFYTNKLCISKRYLAAITHKTVGETPKFTIDKHIIQEIKTLLAFSDMLLQEIADYLHFPDQSYLGRYFKRHTGLSLLEYRTNIHTDNQNVGEE